MTKIIVFACLFVLCGIAMQKIGIEHPAHYMVAGYALGFFRTIVED